jgi:uncharacterized protein (TIGR02217 family)
MSDTLFPIMPGLTWSLVLAPMFNTKIQTAVSGKEYRATLMANPIYFLTMEYEFFRHTGLNELRLFVGFFLARRGAFDNFLYRYDDDSAVTDQPIASGDGKTKVFQLVRSFGEFAEPVQNIDTVTNIKVGGVAKVNNTDYTLSNTGLVTFTVAPAVSVPITWTGSYFYRARFEADQNEYKRFLKNLYEAKTIKLVASLGRRV